MLQKIKSSIIKKKLFSYINERIKLQVIKINKRLQKILYINIINYKFFSGRYINYEPNGIGKEYNGYDDKLIFEGEFLNGQRNGKGKEYNSDGNIIFEGKYLNGKRNGEGNEYNFIYKKYNIDEKKSKDKYLKDCNLKGNYYINRTLVYEGEYLNNKKWNGRGYDKNCNIICKLINGKGKVKEYYDNGKLKFESEYLNGQRNGKGKEYNKDDELIYEVNI